VASAYFKEDCSFSVACLESSVTKELDFAMLYVPTKEDLEIALAVVEHLLDFSMKKEREEREFLPEPAEKRYRILSDRSWELLDKVAQKDIARYLGVTPVAFGRTRNATPPG
jgi:hypothetical protein